MSTFTAKFSEISSDTPTNNAHATATPVAVRAAFELAASGLEAILPNAANENHAEFLSSLISSLQESADLGDPHEIKGVSQQFIDALDRVPKKSLKKDEMCPICAEKFLDDDYPLVVRLPCHPAHKFDLECIAPWIKLKGTCPLDRKELEKKKEVVKVVDDEEEDYDDMIA